MVSRKQFQVPGLHRPASTQSAARVGWEEAFAEMAASGEDELLWPYFPNDFDENEWEWPEMPDAELAPERRPTEPSASVGDACFAKTAPSSRG